MKKAALLSAVSVFFLACASIPAQTHSKQDFGTLTLPEGWTIQLGGGEQPTSTPSTVEGDDDGDDKGGAFDTTFTISDGANTLIYSFRIVEAQVVGFFGTRTHIEGGVVLDIAQSDEGENGGGDSVEVDIRYQEGFAEVTSRSIENFEDWQELALTLQARTDLASRIENGLQALHALNPPLGLQAAISPTVLLILEPDVLNSVGEDQAFDLLSFYPFIMVYSRTEFAPAATLEVQCPNPDGSVDIYEITDGTAEALARCKTFKHEGKVIGGACASPGENFAVVCCVCEDPCSLLPITGSGKCRFVKTKPKQTGGS